MTLFNAFVFSKSSDNEPAIFLGLYSTIDAAKRRVWDYFDLNDDTYKWEDYATGCNLGSVDRNGRIKDYFGGVFSVELDVHVSLDI